MSSQRRILASRANGARSKGPVTPEGKARSAQNATTHGLLSHHVVLKQESSPGYDALSAVFIARFQPVDDVECSLVEEIVAASWRIRRAWSIETRVIENETAASRNHDSLESLVAAFSNPESAQTLDLVHRYETRLHAMYQRALRSLMLLRRERQVAETEAASRRPAPEPVPPPIPEQQDRADRPVDAAASQSASPAPEAVVASHRETPRPASPPPAQNAVLPNEPNPKTAQFLDPLAPISDFDPYSPTQPPFRF